MKDTKEKETSPADQDGIELEETNVILKIPKDAFALKLIAYVPNGEEKPHKCEKDLSLQELIAARKDFLENVEFGDDYDAKYVLSEEGKRYLEELRASGQFGDDDDE